MFEPVALGPAIVANENSKTEPIPRIPQYNQGNGTRFGIVTVTPQAGGLRPFIRHKCIGDRLEALLISRGGLPRRGSGVTEARSPLRARGRVNFTSPVAAIFILLSGKKEVVCCPRLTGQCQWVEAALQSGHGCVTF